MKQGIQNINKQTNKPVTLSYGTYKFLGQNLVHPKVSVPTPLPSSPFPLLLSPPLLSSFITFSQLLLIHICLCFLAMCLIITFITIFFSFKLRLWK